MSSLHVTIGLAFFAGLTSFLSPCVLSLVPVFISYLSGRADGYQYGVESRLTTFLHGLAFIFGFSVVFILFNILASTLGWLFSVLRIWLMRIGGIVIIILGLHMMGVFRIPFLDNDVRIHSKVNRRWGYLSSFAMGIIFAAGWSPCIGPILGAIMTFSINGGSISYGTLLGIAYSIGLAIPFLLAALGIGWVKTILSRFNKVIHQIEVLTGCVLVVAGILLFFGVFNLLAAYTSL